MNSLDRYNDWLSRLTEGDPLYEELLRVKGKPEAINDRFYQDIVFGTAGLRGICGAGTNRMNRLTVGRATRGIANYILKSGLELSKGVVIAYDCRYFSREFSELAAEILTGCGIRVYLFPSLRPTPELSFAIRKLGCISGINLTASHNPKEYNGYKVYWDDGAQISGEVSDGMLEEIEKLDFFDDIPMLSLTEGVENGFVVMLGEEMDRAYLDYVKSLSERDGDELDRSVSIVYTPLNGAGSIPMRRIAEERGFSSFSTVLEQQDPDPDFTTVPSPNPENPKAFSRAEKLGHETGAELLVATDPDSDRMAIEVLETDGEYHFLNGNQTGALLIEYLAAARSEHGMDLSKTGMITSIVTGDLGRTICAAYGIRVFDTLTGFKNICGLIPKINNEGFDYFFGYEESIGAAPGAEVRDKDGISTGMLVMEMAAYYRKQGQSLAEALEALYQKYGYFCDGQVSIVLEGQTGAEKIVRIMKAFREDDPRSFGSFKVEKTIDYLHGYEDIPPQNAMKFIMTDGSWFAMRPSGTEPKIKFYYYTRSSNRDSAENALRKLESAVGSMIESVE